MQADEGNAGGESVRVDGVEERPAAICVGSRPLDFVDERADGRQQLAGPRRRRRRRRLPVLAGLLRAGAEKRLRSVRQLFPSLCVGVLRLRVAVGLERDGVRQRARSRGGRRRTPAARRTASCRLGPGETAASNSAHSHPARALGRPG